MNNKKNKTTKTKSNKLSKTAKLSNDNNLTYFLIIVIVLVVVIYHCNTKSKENFLLISVPSWYISTPSSVFLITPAALRSNI